MTIPSLHDVVAALAHLGFDRGFAISQESPFEFLLWENDGPAPTERQIRSALKELGEIETERRIETAQAEETARAKLLELGLTGKEVDALIGRRSNHAST